MDSPEPAPRPQRPQRQNRLRRLIRRALDWLTGRQPPRPAERPPAPPPPAPPSSAPPSPAPPSSAPADLPPALAVELPATALAIHRDERVEPSSFLQPSPEAKPQPEAEPPAPAPPSAAEEPSARILSPWLPDPAIEWPPLPPTERADSEEDEEDEEEEEGDGYDEYDVGDADDLYLDVNLPARRWEWERKLNRALAEYASPPRPTQSWSPQLAAWEVRLRSHLEQGEIRWIGQITLSEEAFQQICALIRTEARGRKKSRSDVAIRPARVPPTLFITSMVFAARYAKQETDEFWAPYLQDVWDVTYEQGYQSACRKRFIAASKELQDRYGLDFPRETDGDVVRPVYRHALLPRYVQSDFVAWLRDTWQAIHRMVDQPALLIDALQKDPGFGYLPRRLQQFISSPNSRDAAADIIADMVTVIHRHKKKGESAASILAELAHTPLKQELWRAIVKKPDEEPGKEPTKKPGKEPGKEPTAAGERRAASSSPRVDWLWDEEEGELLWRVQKIVIPAGSDLEGRPNRLVWIHTPDEDPADSRHQVDVEVWNMRSGERQIREVLFDLPQVLRDGHAPVGGWLFLLTDMDEQAWELELPPLPTDPILFFRATQATPAPLTPHANVNAGTWLLCATQPLRILDRDNAPIPLDDRLDIPAPLQGRYTWAARVTLPLPATLWPAGESLAPLLTLDPRTRATFSPPTLQGNFAGDPLAPLSPRTCADTEITLILDTIDLFANFNISNEQEMQQARLLTVRIEEEQNNWNWQDSLATLLLETHTRAIPHGANIPGGGTHPALHLGDILPPGPGVYTLDILRDERSILSEPLTFAVVPGLRITIPAPDQRLPDQRPLYSPAQPFSVLLHGLSESNIARGGDITVEPVAGPAGALAQRVTWNDLRERPRLLLSFGAADGLRSSRSTEILLEWTPPRITAWLDPEPPHPTLTPEEFCAATLHVVSEGVGLREFTLDAGKEGARTYKLGRGRAAIKIENDQLKSMVRQVSQMALTLRAGPAAWPLCEVRKRPDLSALQIRLDATKGKLSLRTGLQQTWPGACRFLAISRSNPFARPRELGHTTSLEREHTLPAKLPPDAWILRIELDGVELPIPGTAAHFGIGSAPDAQLPSAWENDEQASDFVLDLVEQAQNSNFHLEPNHLLQLATVRGDVLYEHFRATDLQHLWPVLAALREVQDQEQWLDKHGLLPAWILLAHPLIVSVPRYGHEWNVYPLVAAKEGREGRGYARVTVSGAEKTVLVHWQPAVRKVEVHVQAGLPPKKATQEATPESITEAIREATPEVTRWEELSMSEMDNLHFCEQCGRLLREEGIQKHPCSGQGATLRPINSATGRDDQPFVLELSGERRGKRLLDIFDRFQVPFPTAQSWLPEPAALPWSLPSSSRQMLKNLESAILTLGDKSGNASSLPAAAARLFRHWSEQGIGDGQDPVSETAQAAFALALLLRTASSAPRYHKELLNEAAPPREQAGDLLAELNRMAPAHLAWAMQWVQLLILHSPDNGVR